MEYHIGLLICSETKQTAQQTALVLWMKETPLQLIPKRKRLQCLLSHLWLCQQSNHKVYGSPACLNSQGWLILLLRPDPRLQSQGLTSASRKNPEVFAHCKRLQTIFYVKFSQIATAWKDTSQVLTVSQAHGMWHSHSKERAHFSGTPGPCTLDPRHTNVTEEMENLSCHKDMQSFLFLLIQTESWIGNISESETFFKNNQYKQAQWCIKHVYITETPSLRLSMVLGLGRTSNGSRKWKRAMMDQSCHVSVLARMSEISGHHILKWTWKECTRSLLSRKMQSTQTGISLCTSNKREL